MNHICEHGKAGKGESSEAVKRWADSGPALVTVTTEGRKSEDTPRSSSQPAETGRPRTDPGLCALEPSGTVGSLSNAKQKGGNEYVTRQIHLK